ncbi:MAG: hypothetical protein PHX39_10335 [Bacteroidales bacterium]|jgi:hypothetical protein|nr:hypothetical protein [Bacteroidales bacterium]MDD4177964.1 hypothetical protein [Bacteroidales bacterium]MDD4742708.1 hypothetical protein [Bacteroidales bacterium]
MISQIRIYLISYQQYKVNRQTLVRLYLHFQFGDHLPIVIDASTINLDNVSKDDLKDLGNGRYGLSLYDKYPLRQAAIAFDKITLNDQGNNQYSISPDYYDFNIEWQNGFSKKI